MFYLKYSSLIQKIIIGLFLVANLILSFDFTSNPCLMKYVNAHAFMGCAFGENFIVNSGILIIELISVFSLFTNKKKFKLISNLCLYAMCFVDIGLCMNLQNKQLCIEIILNLIFILLITVDIIITYKKPKNDTEIIPQ